MPFSSLIPLSLLASSEMQLVALFATFQKRFFQMSRHLCISGHKNDFFTVGFQRVASLLRAKNITQRATVFTPSRYVFPWRLKLSDVSKSKQWCNKEFRAGARWQYQHTVGTILIISSKVDLGGFGKLWQKAVFKRAHMRFLIKKGTGRALSSPL